MMMTTGPGSWAPGPDRGVAGEVSGGLPIAKQYATRCTREQEKPAGQPRLGPRELAAEHPKAVAIVEGDLHELAVEDHLAAGLARLGRLRGARGHDREQAHGQPRAPS